MAIAVIVDKDEEPEKPCDPVNENASTGFFYTAKEHRDSMISIGDESIKGCHKEPQKTHYQTVGHKVRVNTTQYMYVQCMNSYIVHVKHQML